MSVPSFLIPLKQMVATGLKHTENVHYQTPPEELVQQSLAMGEGVLNDTGALVVMTGKFTGRSPLDKYIVRDEVTADTINWNEFNHSIEEKTFLAIRQQINDHLASCPAIWVRDAYACADPRYRLNIRVVTDKPWLSLFAYNMFLRPTEEELDGFDQEWTILAAPDLQLDAKALNIRQSNAAVISFRHKTIAIAGTGYTGETKKGIFTVLNYILPMKHDVLSMHCSANKGVNGDTALFFGLSGTGKTTLSADPSRQLIGDDEHGWTDNNVFNFEGGCYAKCINLSADKEPEIYGAIRPGALVENTRFLKGTNKIDFDDATITENTRVSYPLDYISNAADPSVGAIPDNIFFLTCDAYGVLPPISRLTAPQAMYQFISGYTAKVAGTETGVTCPKSTFSACFGAPFLPLHPGRYAEMLGQRLIRHKVKVWLINTGWTGGPYGTGHRMKLSFTRSMIKAAIDGKLDGVAYEKDPVFGMAVPLSCPGVPVELLQPRNTWADSAAYDQQAACLAAAFQQNFSKYASGVSAEILAAGPLVQ
ncbi:phosphoenolpyruvate carboxykinase (ATP) [Flavihumibacter petaseus]|uniref:Phosphoenolpyruvate carboxykinase (ATP) n=1 Tax=Flavihumibacter petaseus NBRC 106054 TaxID=1220578 RepID=A0A0E9MUW2_9BACT|nr:phosphoenolpyruvate carboxykinase (ATP) [Flavihumibacter petaseus]GAO41288.1 ATP-dependent phosphoenolpyruvate carboxykinase [Flavihumibacter petaseus NBRC 106054]